MTTFTVKLECHECKLVRDIANAVNNRPDLIVYSQGYKSITSSRIDESSIISYGHQSVSANTGDDSIATNDGCRSAVINTGDSTVSFNRGYRAVSVNMGHKSIAISDGQQSVAIGVGHQATVIAKQKDSIAITSGRAKACAGSAIVLCSRNINGDLLHIFASKVGENGIEPDMWYTLSDDGLPIKTWSY